MPVRDTDPPVIAAQAARRLLMHAQGLLEHPTKRVTSASLLDLIHRMGFVQLDSINMVERAHHLTLASRLDGYRHEQLRTLHEKKRALFEHWTHDASIIPVAFFGPWKERGRRFVARHFSREWLQRRIGPEPDRVIAEVLERVEREGPVQSRDFEHPEGKKSSPWWGWKPHKAALEFLWWRGDLSVAARINFHKVYDLTHRVYPDHHGLEAPDDATWIDWSCRQSIERLGVATQRELAGFFGGVTLAEARSWCAEAEKRGEIVRVQVEAVDGSKPRESFALPDWRERAKRADRALERLDGRMRLLSPFDPVLRDRARAKRLFGFDYTFEAFVPAPKRKYGYYVLPVMRGDEMVGRADVKFHRDKGVLKVNGLWWERSVKPTKSVKAEFGAAAERLAAFIGAATVKLPRR